MPAPSEIVALGVATVDAELPAPVVFGDWVMRTREYVVVRLRLASDHEGWAFTLSRGGAVAEQIRKSVAPSYLGRSVDDRTEVFASTYRQNLPCHSGGVGLRALSVVDMAAWDATARLADQSIAGLLGGSNRSMPATAIVGYPPALMGPDQVFDQVSRLYSAGWRRFKAPVAADSASTAGRLRAIRRAAPDGWIGCDGAWVYEDVESALALLSDITDVGLGWFEDVFPPGHVAQLRRLREEGGVPIAMGDEQGGAYYPEALVAGDAVDVVRIDVGCMGGVSRLRGLIETCERAGLTFAPHMFAHVHSQLFSALGHDVPIEWGFQGTGVDPYADSLRGPSIVDGRMEPLLEGPGFGDLVNLDWISTQVVDDPDRILL